MNKRKKFKLPKHFSKMEKKQHKVTEAEYKQHSLYVVKKI